MPDDLPQQADFQLKSSPGPVYGTQPEYVAPPIHQKPSDFGKPYAFELEAGEGGASIWFGQLITSITILEFERRTIRGKDYNVLLSQPAIKKMGVVPPKNLDKDHQLQTHLGWYGNVYLYWEMNDTGDVTICEVKGPDEPEGQDISALDEDLTRDVPLGKYFILLGKVDNNKPVDQLISSDVYWAVTIARGEMASGSESEGSEAESSAIASGSAAGSAPSGAESAPSGELKSSAIVPLPLSPTKFAALLTVESPEVLFLDVQQLPVFGHKVVYNIDPWFIAVCEPDSIRLLGPCGDRPCLIGGRISGNQAIIEMEVIRGGLPRNLCFMLCGTRRAFAGTRFPLRDLEQFVANERHLNSAYPAKDFSAYRTTERTYTDTKNE